MAAQHIQGVTPVPAGPTVVFKTGLSPTEERPRLTATYLADGVIQIRVNLDLLGKLGGFYLHKCCSDRFQVAPLAPERHSA